MTDKQTIQRWTPDFHDFEVEESEDGDFVLFIDYERIVSEMQHEIEKLKIELSIANSETTKLEGDFHTCQESLSYLQWSHPAVSSESLFSRASRWLSEPTGWSPRQR